MIKIQISIMLLTLERLWAPLHQPGLQPLLMGTVNNPSPILMVGCGVTDNLNSCQSWAALQNSIWLVKHTHALHPAPSQERTRRKDMKSDKLGSSPSCMPHNILSYYMDSQNPFHVVEGSIHLKATWEDLAQCLMHKRDSVSNPAFRLFPWAPQPFTACHFQSAVL